jgi:CRISPR-associated protein Csb2
LHVWLRFDCPVAGPVILGAGRFMGYGLCKPIERVK